MKYRIGVFAMMMDMVRFLNEEKDSDGNYIERRCYGFDFLGVSVYLLYTEERVGMMQA